MWFLVVLFALLHPLLSTRVANAERKLPADLQVELLFPRNETYAPTQLFPIVFGIKNLDAVWPLDLKIWAQIQQLNWPENITEPYWTTLPISLYSDDLKKAVGEAPDTHYFHYPAVNMTNGTTGNFMILWEAVLPAQCFANSTDPEDDDGGYGWSNSPDGYASRGIQFSTAPGAQLPDIEALVDSCPELDSENSVAFRITEVRKTYGEGKTCPVLDTDVKPTKCAFKSAAKELAANVSAAMLHEMRCEEGTWQTIKSPCPREESMASLQSAGFAVTWVPLALAFAASNML